MAQHSVKKFAELYKRTEGGVQWFTNPLLMAAVTTAVEADATKIDANMAKFGLSGEEIKAQLNSIVTGVPVVVAAQTPPTEEAAAVVADAPAEGAETTGTVGTAALTEETTTTT